MKLRLSFILLYLITCIIITKCELGRKRKDFKDMNGSTRDPELRKDESFNASPSEVEEKGSIVFLRRFVKRLMDQTGIEEESFKKDKHLTAQIPVQLTHNEYKELANFANPDKVEGISISIQEVDVILANILKPGYATTNWLAFVQEFFSIPSMDMIKISLVILGSITALYIYINVLVQLFHFGPNRVVPIVICFQLICVFSYVWAFLEMYGEAEANSKLSQERLEVHCDRKDLTPPPDGILGYFRVQLWGYRDKCDQLYVQSYKDPLWSVNPMDVFARSIAGLAFSQLPYIGDKIGQFIGGIMFVVPDWMKPVLFLPFFMLILLFVFGVNIRAPFLTLEFGGSKIRQALGDGRPRTVVEHNARRAMRN